MCSPHTGEHSITTEEVSLFHEAGHAVASWRLRVPFKYVTVSERGNYVEPDVRYVSFRREAIERVILALLAGEAAQRMMAPTSRFGGHQDYRNARWYARLIAKDPAERRRLLKQLKARAQKLVADHQDDIEFLALHLALEGTLSAKRVRMLLK